MEIKIYPAIFEKSEKDGFIVSFPDLPGCLTQGKTIFEAFKYAKEALALYLDGEENLAKPSDPQSIKCPQNGYVMLVEAEPNA